MFRPASSICFSRSSSLFATEGTLLYFFGHIAFGVYPIIRSYGDFFVVAFGQQLCANSAKGSHLCQSSCRSSHQNLRYCSSHWFVLSDCPSVRGWEAVDMFWCIFSDSHSPLAYFEVNLVPLSVMIFLGVPCLVKTYRR